MIVKCRLHTGVGYTLCITQSIFFSNRKSFLLQNDNTNIYSFAGLLNGELLLSQNGTVRSTEFISSAQDLNETIYLSPSDMEVLSNATYYTTYWFIDCGYIGASNNLTSIKKYLNENQKYDLEVLVVASFEPLPDPTTTTTTTTTTRKY